jgi:hypothetical protein
MGPHSVRSVEYTPFQQRSPLQIDPQIIKDLEQDGFKLQWICDTVTGMPLRDGYAGQNQWDPVRRNDWGGLLSKYSEDQDGPADAPITYGGLILHVRPIEVHRIAKEHEKREAQDKLDGIQGLIDGGMPGVTGSRHPTALRTNRINKTVERLPLPGNDE